jgi:hypothetical protein
MNCENLKGMRCPECKSEGPFSIVSSCVAVWNDDGTDDIHDVEFDDESPCRCMNCDYCSTVGGFKEILK